MPENEAGPLSLPELQALFGFSNADLLANRAGNYSFGQHRLVTTGIAFIAFAFIVLLTWPIQREAGRILGVIGGLCFGSLDLVALLAFVAGVGALWNTARESKQSPLATFTGYVALQQNKDESYALTSDAFIIPVSVEVAEGFRSEEYTVYYVPKFVGDRDNLFSIEPARVSEPETIAPVPEAGEVQVHSE